MPRYLGMFKYSAEGNKGFLKEKATGREAATRQALESVGGKLEAMYWIISGEYTGIGIWEFPDAATGAALSALTASTGAFAESMRYRAPGR